MNESTNEKSLHFLVVDDDDGSRKTIVEYLTAMGHEKISLARDGAEALRLLDQDSTVNFIISDWDMPRMNGLALLQKVRSHPNRYNIPFLISTSPVSQEAEKIVMAAESYVDAYVIKPFRLQVLQEKITKMLELSVHGPQKAALVVDDDPDSRAMVVEYLKQLGFKVVHPFENGKLALEFLRQNTGNVGMIVSDWEMPEMSGIELLRACKSHQALKEIPFLMITSQGSMERMKVMQAAQAQVDQYLLKPFNLAEMKKRIDTVVEKSRSSHEVHSLITEALSHLDSGRYQRAQHILEKALKLDPENDATLRLLGDSIIRVKGAEMALPFYKRAVESNPAHVKGYLKLAAAYDQIGLLDKAVALIQSANQQIGFSADLHFHLGKLYIKKGMPLDAQYEFEKTLELELNHQEARLMLGMIKTGNDGA